MREFAALYAELDETTRTAEKVKALARFFEHADPGDAAWTVYVLTGRKLRQVVPTRRMREWATELAGVPDWLFQECYDAVGDLSETIALLLPPPRGSVERPLHQWIEEVLIPLRELEESIQREALCDAWMSMNTAERFVWNKLIGGAFRVGVSQQLVVRALANVAGLEPATVAHRLMGNWSPTRDWYARLLQPDAEAADRSRPYPFFLAHPIEKEPSELGERGGWLAEWKWDGIRAQLIRRGGETFLWTRGEELVTERYPEISGLGPLLPDGTAIDGEILPWKDGMPLPFSQLQRRIGRKTIGKKILADVPVVLLAYDLIESNGTDLREWPLRDRRAKLAELIDHVSVSTSLMLSPSIEAPTWEELAAARELSREKCAEGVMLKRFDSPYRVGRVRGDWWKWKIQPFTVDAVLTAAQRGSGRRASLYTDYTFSVWDDSGRLVPIAKAYSGLTDEEIARVDAWIRRHMVEKFGPVRTVTPELVFELAFEGIQLSTRHKSGIAVRFPRILRWRTDKPATEADTLATLRALLSSKAT